MKQSTCTFCGINFEYKTGSCGGKFCSAKCMGAYRSRSIVDMWKRGEISAIHKGLQIRKPIRAYILKTKGDACQICGWRGINPVSRKPTVEIDHIDGNHLNNSEDNLRVICPNCHSLTPTWKNTGNTRGSGRGRETRRNPRT